MATTTFEIGDVVQLKAGGPKMTVELAAIDALGETLTCTWLEHGERQTRPIAAGKLERAPLAAA